MYTGFTKGKSKDRPPLPHSEGRGKQIYYLSTNNIGLGFWCLMPISTIFELLVEETRIL